MRDNSFFPDHPPAARFDAVRELKPILHEEIGHLPSRLRDAIVLSYFEGLRVDDAARRLGCPVGTLESRLDKARESLLARLARRGLAAPAVLLLMFSMTEEVLADAPWSLLDKFVKAGHSRLEGTIVSRKVASMVIAEEANPI